MSADVVVVRFWEARVAPGRLDDATRWVEEWLHARSRLADGYVSGEVFVADAAGDQPARVVLLTRWSQPPAHVDELEAVLPPDGSIERAHGWSFRPTS